jgi:uncharacterized membrane protein required for colicin V production
MNYFDPLIVLVLLISFYSGYKNGLIKTIFRTAGYIAGGLAGLALAVKYLATWESQTQKVALALLAVFIGASVGEFLLGKIGSLFKKVLFIPPFEFIDSLLGALVSLIRTSFISCLVVIFLIFSRWDMAEKYVKPSVSYQVIEAQLPAVLTALKNHFG